MTTLEANAPANAATSLRRPGLLSLSLGSFGVVYGDIGTSPLYAFREAMLAAGGVNRESVLSLILWALMVIATAKYFLILLRADNQGEGGTLSLLALAQRAMGRRSMPVLAVGLIEAALFYGDAAITPAISVLSAVEGLKLVTSSQEPYVLPITFAIIILLFLAQSRGTAAVARLFGPITLIWFVVLAVGGLIHIAADLGILVAMNPVHALRFVSSHGRIGLIVLGAVFLAVTGAEPLYADLGHFGRSPIQLAWVAVALPALTLNYLGQGALVLADPQALENPFFLMYPDWALLPVVILAAMATIITSQAVITGAHSLTRQAIQLRLLARLKIRHTWETQGGQIYLASVNTLLLVAVLALVLGFGSSSDLASAYGISVTGTIVATAILALIVVHRHWGWPLWAAVALMHSLKHVKSLHDQNVILTVVTAPVPRVDPQDRVSMDTINARFRRVTLTFGYMEDPDVPQALALCRTLGWRFNIMTTSFLLSRRTLKLSRKSALPGWQSRLFIVMARNATGASDYFHIPAGRVVEIGTQVNL